MNRIVGGAALCAVVLLSIPITPAAACTPALPQLTVDRDRVPRGGRVTVSGVQVARANGGITACDMFVPTLSPTPALTESPPTATPSVTETPLVTLPPLERVAVARRAVTVTIAEYREWPAPGAPARTLGVVMAGTRTPDPDDDDLFRFEFAWTVTIPRSLETGRYVLHAYEKDSVNYGDAVITVTNGLAATGADARLGVLTVLLLVGAAVLVRQQQAHRLGSGGRAVAERPAHR